MAPPKQRTQTDLLDPARAAALHATLNRPGTAPQAGDPLPPFWHYIYFWDIQPPGALGRDGHPKPGGFLPDTGLPRRMWAGGQLEFLSPILIGQSTSRTSTIASVTKKIGRSGPLALVTVNHEIHQNGGLCLRERQDLIYRQDPDPNAIAPAAKQARKDADHCRDLAADPTLLFRYSALTFNGHRIHYDRDYCRDVEGYPGLVVHGPLLAQYLLHFAQDLLGEVRSFNFRATAPLFDFEPAKLCANRQGDHLSLWVRGPDARQCMQATAQ